MKFDLLKIILVSKDNIKPNIVYNTTLNNTLLTLLKPNPDINTRIQSRNVKLININYCLAKASDHMQNNANKIEKTYSLRP